MNDDSIIRIGIPRAAEKPPERAKPRALGRGLGALLGETRREEALVQASKDAGSTGGLAMLPVARIEPHPDQPRRRFDEAPLAELAASIAARGVIQPVIVRPLGEGRYQLVAGERRWRAAQIAQVHEIPALVRDLDEREVTALALIENLQREDLNPIEEARAYSRLAEGLGGGTAGGAGGLTQAEIAKMVDKSRSHVANLQRLLTLPAPVIELVEEGRLSMGHARALVGADNAVELAANAVAKGLSVREIERQVRKRPRENAPPRRARAGRDGTDAADIAAVQGHLEEFLGLAVRINADADPRSGAVTIRYRTLDQLDLICQRLTGGGI